MQNDPNIQNLINELVNQRLNEFLANQANNNLGERTENEPNDDGWIRASESREAGERDIPESLQQSFSKDPLENIFHPQSIRKFLDNHPEPRGGFLKTQFLDWDLDCSPETRKKDEELAEIQRDILLIIRPMLTVYETIEPEAEFSQTAASMLATVKKCIEYANHIGGKICHIRRKNVLRAIGARNFDEISRNPSSNPNVLFGPENRKEIANLRPKAQAPVRKSSQGGQIFGANKKQYNPKKSSNFYQQNQKSQSNQTSQSPQQQ